MGRIVARKGGKNNLLSHRSLKGYESATRSFDTKGEARSWTAEIEAEMKNRGYKDPRRAHWTLVEALDRDLETVTPQKAKQLKNENVGL